MKTYVCDFCNDYIGNNVKRVQMREINAGGILSKKKKIHICQHCWFEIAEKSRDHKFKMPDNYTEFLGTGGADNA